MHLFNRTLSEQALDATGEIEWILADLAADKAAHPENYEPPGLLGRMADAGLFRSAAPATYTDDLNVSAELRPDYST